MDLAVSIVAGVAVRAFLLGRSDLAVARYSPALVGAWEGIIVHQLSSRSSSDVDHFLAFGLRMVVDHLVSGDPSRTVMIVIWTTIGFVVSESVTPRSTLQPLPPIRRERRHRSSTGRSLPSSHARSYRRYHSPESSRPRTALTTPTPVAPRLPPFRHSLTPKAPVHRPATPPSLFLQDPLSENASPIPEELHPLELSPTRPPTGVAVLLEAAETPPTPKRNGLPTPPQTQSAPSENIDYTNGKEEETETPPRRLSTIQEMSSGEETSPVRTITRQRLDEEPLKPIAEQPTTTSPSSATERPPVDTQPGTPLLVPNSTMLGFVAPKSFNPNEFNDDELQHSTPYSRTSPPIPVPNFTTANWQPRNAEGQENPDLLSPLSGGPPEFGARHTRDPQSQSEPSTPNTEASTFRAPTPPSVIRAPVVSARPAQNPLSSEPSTPSTGASTFRPPTPPSPRRPIPPPTSDELLSPVSDIGEFDELRTPPRTMLGGGVIVPGEIGDDPLRTPPMLGAQQFSPLLFDAGTLPSSSSKVPAGGYTRTFGQPSNFQPFALDSDLDKELDDPPVPGSLPTPVRALPSSSRRLPNDPPSDPETIASDHSSATSVLSTREPTKLTRKAEKLRQSAREAEQELRNLRGEYDKAMKEKRFRDALVIKAEIAEMEEEVGKLHRSAAKRYYASLNDYNPKKKPHTIDVHGLRPAEALERTEKELRKVLKSGQSSFRVIVGKGLHSVNGQPVLKGVITAAMERQKVTVRVDVKNTGVLILTLPSR